jgi:hypothetical protein
VVQQFDDVRVVHPVQDFQFLPSQIFDITLRAETGLVLGVQFDLLDGVLLASVEVLAEFDLSEGPLSQRLDLVERPNGEILFEVVANSWEFGHQHCGYISIDYTDST